MIILNEVRENAYSKVLEMRKKGSYKGANQEETETWSNLTYQVFNETIVGVGG